MELVLVDTSQIQSFIFGSNRLRENAGASFLVSQATEVWPEEIIEKPESSGKKIYSGGGNVLLAFDDPKQATAFIRKLSERVIAEAPGLQIAFARQTLTDDFCADYQGLQRQLREKKRSGETSVPLLGLGVTRRCESTGLPANGMSREIEEDPETSFPASHEVIEKSRMGDEATKNLNIRFKEILGKDYEFPRQLDNLGRSEGEHSYIAVVHIDGDGMGQRIEKLIKESDNAIAELSNFSTTLDKVGKATLRTIIQMLVDRVGSGEIMHKKDAKEIAKIKLAQKKNEGGEVIGGFLPFRPIIYGGDDLTFVCDGRLGIALALAFMHEFERQSEGQKLPGGKATASAGIAIVKVHYPFARAYSIAEELCQSAKKYKQKNSLACACFDWHFALSGLSGDLEEIREREYKARWREDDKIVENPVHLRPYALDPNSTPPYRTWSSLEKLISEFQRPDIWFERRNKLKALNTALRGGPKKVEWFLKKYDQGDLPEAVGGLPDWKSKGWNDGQCPYFDALELADWYMPLVNENGGKL